ncbi:MAG: hypothetical protein HC896_00835 [Bacteroidales bacterium]|nr:hypothetical protein [Bacteroidales bacterium]
MISGEIFNLLGVKNTVSLLWIRTIGNQNGMSGYYGVPNHLTARRYNLKLTVRF